MTTPAARRGAALRFLALGFVLCLSGPAPGAPPNRGNRGDALCSAAGSLDRLRQIAASLAARGKVAVVIDPAIAPAIPPRVPPDDLPIDQALDAALAPLRHVAWRRICLTPEQREVLPSAEALSTAARALEQQKVDSLLIENPAAKRATLFLKDQPLSPSLDSMRERGKLRREPVYLVYSTAAGLDAPRPGRQLADLQRQQMEMAMPPEQRALAMVQMMQLMQSMPPASREEFAQRTLQAGMRLWDSTPPTQRQEMIHQTVQLMQAFGAAPKVTGSSRSALPPPPAGPPPADPRERARRLGAALAIRCGGTFLVEPALPLSQPVDLPDGNLPVEKALQAVTAAEPGTAWRRLYMTEAQLKRMPSAESLAAAVRTLEALEAGSMLLENRSTERDTLYLKDQASILDEAMKAGRFRDQPIYLLYSTTPAAQGGTLLERFADLQRRQIGLMLQMSPDQMAHSMEQAIQTFQSADDVTRTRLMGLPVMAGMMAVWFPQEAKERGAVTP